MFLVTDLSGEFPCTTKLTDTKDVGDVVIGITGNPAAGTTAELIVANMTFGDEFVCRNSFKLRCILEDKPKTLKEQMDNLLWGKLAEHWGHNVRIVKYGDPEAPDDVCLECDDCGLVVLDAELYTLCARSDGDDVSVIDAILEALPKEPRPFNTDDNFWTNGDEILCPSEGACETLAEFFKALLKDTNTDILTGWYDPDEDARNDEIDGCSGFNYIRFE